jgi:hypothetical protein
MKMINLRLTTLGAVCSDRAVYDVVLWPPQLLGFRFRIPPVTRMSVFCECSVLSGRILRVFGLFTHPEESYRLRCPSVIVKSR